MPITITLDSQDGTIITDLEATNNPSTHLLRAAIGVVQLLNEYLGHDPQTCDECLAKQAEANQANAKTARH